MFIDIQKLERSKKKNIFWIIYVDNQPICGEYYANV